MKQTGGKFFITSEDSILIDEGGFYKLIEILLELKLIDDAEINKILWRKV